MRTWIQSSVSFHSADGGFDDIFDVADVQPVAGGPFAIDHERCFRELQEQRSRRNTGPGQLGGQVVRKVRVVQTVRRESDRDWHRAAFAAPHATLLEGSSEHPAVKPNYQPGLFGQRNEQRRRQ